MASDESRTRDIQDMQTEKREPDESMGPSAIDAQEASLPQTPPDPIEQNGDVKSRKREREVSLEPGTPQATATEIDPERTEPKERRAPAKKNRVGGATLGATEEEDEDTAVVSCSPPHESKMRQISQGVEDLTWQNIRRNSANSDLEPEPAVADADSQQGIADKDKDQLMEDVQRTEEEQQMPPQEQKEQEVKVPPLLVNASDPPILGDEAGLDEQAGEESALEKPPDAIPDDVDRAVAANVVEGPLAADMPARADVPGPSAPPSDSESDKEKFGLKRKLGDRTVSEQFVPDGSTQQNDAVAESSSAAGTGKRQRDDADEDANPRVTKRPTPPPDEEKEKEQPVPPPSPPKTTPKLGGFMAYVSASSPLASVKGPSLFSPKPASPWSTTASAGSSAAPSPALTASTSAFSPMSVSSSSASQSPFKGLSTPTPTETPSAQKRTGFEAFASATSPFASAAKRSKSPTPTNALGALSRSRSPSRHGQARAANAFTVYAANGAQSFTAHAKRGSGSPALANPLDAAFLPGPAGQGIGLGVLVPEGESGSGKDSGEEGADESEEREEEREMSFGERLRSHKDEGLEDDDQPKLELTEQEVRTGEENEDTVFKAEGKLYVLSADNQWRERGKGSLHLNVPRYGNGAARLVMRREMVHSLLLNVPLFKGMNCCQAQDPRYTRFSVLENGVTTHYNFRIKDTRLAFELREEVNSRIPTE